MLRAARPKGSSFYMTDGRNEFIAWAPPAGNRLCMAATGRTEHQLVREILEGKWDKVLHGEEAAAG